MSFYGWIKIFMKIEQKNNLSLKCRRSNDCNWNLNIDKRLLKAIAAAIFGCIAPSKYIFYDDMTHDYDPTLIDIVQLDDVVVVVSVISGFF